MREQSVAARIGRESQYVTVYSGMETGPFLSPPVPREAVRRQLGIRPEHVVVGTIARLFELKGHDDLLDVAPKLCAAYPNLRFLWVGDGILRGEFEKRMEAMGLRDRFVLTGMVPPSDVPKYTAAMDVLAHPSRRGGGGRALPRGGLGGGLARGFWGGGEKGGVVGGGRGGGVAGGCRG